MNKIVVSLILENLKGDVWWLTSKYKHTKQSTQLISHIKCETGHVMTFLELHRTLFLQKSNILYIKLGEGFEENTKPSKKYSLRFSYSLKS